MVRKLATLTGIPYQTDYARHYGGYNLYYQKEKGGGHFRGQFGFDYRKNTREMYYYLLTVLEKLENKEE